MLIIHYFRYILFTLGGVNMFLTCNDKIFIAIIGDIENPETREREVKLKKSRVIYWKK